MSDVPSKNFTFYFLHQKYLKRKYSYIRYLLILVKNYCKKMSQNRISIKQLLKYRRQFSRLINIKQILAI